MSHRDGLKDPLLNTTKIQIKYNPSFFCLVVFITALGIGIAQFSLALIVSFIDSRPLYTFKICLSKIDFNKPFLDVTSGYSYY